MILHLSAERALLHGLQRANELTRLTLILHGASGDSAPVTLSETLRDRCLDLVEIESFEAGHILRWHSDADEWRDVVSSWL